MLSCQSLREFKLCTSLRVATKHRPVCEGLGNHVMAQRDKEGHWSRAGRERLMEEMGCELSVEGWVVHGCKVAEGGPPMWDS